MIDSLVELYRLIGQHNVLVSYQGAVSNDMIMYLVSVIETKRSLSPKMKRVFGVFLEMAQNVMHYSEELMPDIGRAGRLMVTEHDDLIIVSASNAVSDETAERVKTQIDHLNELTKDEQKAYFLEKRKQPAPEGSRGAGLGLIEIARKSDAPLSYTFLPHEKPGFRNLLLMATLKK
jgi:hypothetical protein